MKLTQEQVKNRKRWVKALRSGKYTQERGYLRTENGFCCLGVLCDIQKKGKWSLSSGQFAAVPVYEFSGTNVYSPPGAISKSVNVYLKDGYISFDTLNDDHGMSFDEIADVIVIDTIERNGKW